MRPEDIFTKGDKENQEYLASAIEYTRKLEEQKQSIIKQESISSSMSEEERRERRDLAIQAQRQKILEELAESKQALEYVYLAFPDEFAQSVKAVLRKELKHLNKDFEFCMLFPYNDNKFKNCGDTNQSSIIYIYVKVDDCIKIAKLVYYTWKDDYGKSPFNYVFQKNYICNTFDLEIPFKNFSEIGLDAQVYKIKY